MENRAPVAPAEVTVSVADLGRSVDYWENAIGLQVNSRENGTARMGVPGRDLVVLQEQPGARPGRGTNTGLFHLALLLPDRASLAGWLEHAATDGVRLTGASDHFVSEALYLRDPDGHGIEIYADRPREGWRWVDGRVQMGGGPIDVRGLHAEAERAGERWSGMPAGTIIGHVHLRVGDVAAAEAFYHGVLGFDVVAGGPSALFVSAGGYHHHLGLNTW